MSNLWNRWLWALRRSACWGPSAARCAARRLLQSLSCEVASPLMSSSKMWQPVSTLTLCLLQRIWAIDLQSVASDLLNVRSHWKAGLLNAGQVVAGQFLTARVHHAHKVRLPQAGCHAVVCAFKHNPGLRMRLACWRTACPYCLAWSHNNCCSFALKSASGMILGPACPLALAHCMHAI